VDAPADLDELLDLLEESAAYDDEEAVDLLAHGLQCAAALADTAPTDLELQIAGLVHDLGHVVAPGDDIGHPVVGAAAVAALLGDRVAFLVRHHVDAKRWLVTHDPAYAKILSPRSAQSLTVQGGVLTEVELAALNHSHERDALIALRRADDAAKVPGAPVPGLLSWLPVLRTVAGHRDG
jgi:predicted HD phosphohydrolase